MSAFQSASERTAEHPEANHKVDELAEQFVNELRSGARPSISDYVRRYPEYAAEIREIFPVLANLERAAGDTSAYDHSRGTRPEVPKQLGDYRIIAEVGHGGMGVVYEAEHITLRRRVALKVLADNASLHSLRLQRFHREARAAGRLHHTNIVPVFEVGEDHGIHFYAMQFIRGQSLDLVIAALRRLRENGQWLNAAPDLAQHEYRVPPSEVIAQSLVSGHFEVGQLCADLTEDSSSHRIASLIGEKPAVDTTQIPQLTTPQLDLAVSSIARVQDSTDKHSSRITPPSNDPSTDNRYYHRVARIGLQVADAIGFAHSQGVIHRDIKPANLILDTCGVVWVTDFGLATHDDEQLTRSGDLVGTLCYMAPERLQGHSDARSDIYALGLTLYELCTLRSAFVYNDRGQLIRQITHDEPATPRSLASEIPRDLETIILKAIDKHPSRRYQTAEDLADDLRLFLNDMPVRARRITPIERLWRFSRRNPITASLLSCVVALMMVVILGSITFGINSRRQSNRLQEQTRIARESELNALNLLYEFSRKEAEAARTSGHRGQRGDGLAAVSRAVSLLPRLNGSNMEIESARDSLRNDAISCLARSDLHKFRSWQIADEATPNVVFDSNMERYAQADRQGNIIIRRVADDSELVRLVSPGFPAWSIAFSPDDQFLAATYHPSRSVVQHIAVWNVTTGKKLIGDDGPFGFGAFSFRPDSKQIAIGLRADALRFYSHPDGVRAEQDLNIGAYPMSVKYSSRGDCIAVSHGSKYELRIIYLDNRPSVTITTPQYIRGLSWTDDNSVLAGGCENGKIFLWNTNDFEAPPQEFAQCDGAVVRLAFNHHGDRIASYAWDNTMRIWDLTSGRQILRTENVAFISNFTADDRFLAYATPKREFGIWEILDRGPMKILVSPAARRTSVEYLPTHPHIAISLTSNGLEFWNTTTGRLEATMPIRSTDRVVVSRDGSALFEIGSRGLRRWPIVTNDAMSNQMRIGPPEGISNAGFVIGTSSPTANNTLLAVPSSTAGKLFDLKDFSRQVRLGNHENRWGLALSPDGKWVATSAWFGEGIRIWDTTTGTLVHKIDIPRDKAWVDFHPDGTRLAVSTGEELAMYETTKWHKIATLPRDNEDEWPGKIAFSPDGKMLVAAYSRRRCQLVDCNSMQRLALLDSPIAGTVNEATFSSDGSELTYVSDNQLHVWDLRELRRQLAQLTLDWNLPSLSPSADRSRDRPAQPFHLKVVLPDNEPTTPSLPSS